MSTLLSTAQAIFAPAMEINLLDAIFAVLGAVFLATLLNLFKPLLKGIARALYLVVKPKQSRDQRLAERQMLDAALLNTMVKAMDGGSPSHAAELRALASR